MTPTVLAIDTSSATGSVAIVRGGAPIAGVTLTSLPGHSESLLFAISRLLHDAGLTIDGIDLFAAGVGPGSFTGLRVGLSAMKGLHLATGAPLLGVSSLLALAMNAGRHEPKGGTASAHASRLMPHSSLVCAAIDARRGDVFAAAYRVVKGAFQPVLDEQMTRPPELHGMLEGLGERIVCLGDAFHAPGAEVRGQKTEVGKPTPDLRPRTSDPGPPSAPLVPALPFMEVPPDPVRHLPSAVNVADVAVARHARGESDNVAGLEPRYVRPVDFKTA